MSDKPKGKTLCDVFASDARRRELAKPANPYAFPTPSETSCSGGLKCYDEGMTLRDYFAAAALQGMVAGGQGLEISRHDFARDSYALADAMLKERAKP